MRRVVRVLAWVGVGIVLFGIVGAVTIPLLSEYKQRRVVKVEVPDITFPSGDELLERGKHLYETRGCQACHAGNGGGKVVIEDAKAGLKIRAPNISPGSVASSYRDTDWVRLLRHGVKPSGVPVFVMPSEDYAALTDMDVAAVATYVRSFAPAPPAAAQFEIPFLLKALYVVGIVKDAAEKIDHTRPAPATVPEALTPQYGKYIATMCTGCHGPGLSGGKIPGTPPSWPPAANLTTAPDGVIQHYQSPEEFREMIRSGKRPDGSAISTVMPFSSLRRMNDLELDALYLFLKTTRPRATGSR